jgi:hypothetical protein
VLHFENAVVHGPGAISGGYVFVVPKTPKVRPVSRKRW